MILGENTETDMALALATDAIDESDSEIRMFDPEAYGRYNRPISVVNNDITGAFVNLGLHSDKLQKIKYDFASLSVPVSTRIPSSDVAALMARSPNINATAALVLLANVNPKFSEEQHVTYGALVAATCEVLGATGEKMASLEDDAPPAKLYAILIRARHSGKTRLLCALATSLLCNTGPVFARASRISFVTQSRDDVRIVTQYILDEVWLQPIAVELLAFAPSGADYFTRFKCALSGRTCTIVGADSEAFATAGLADADFVLIDEPANLSDETRAKLHAAAVTRVSIGTHMPPCDWSFGDLHE